MRLFRGVLLLGYLAITATSFAATWAPRVFWTMIMPAVPLLVVLLGFYRWRHACPIARVGELGARLAIPRRVPRLLARRYLTAPLALLALLLLARLVALNGDPLLVGALLVSIAVAAAGCNALYGGRAWCNYLCPVGVVERLYTDGIATNANPRPACARCTGCKSACPDLDQSRAYASDLGAGDRRIAGYAWPGLVLGFYAYYWLRAGDWAAFFDGAWTVHPFDRALILGSGLFFAPGVPALLAAAATLVAGAAASLGLFYLAERLWVRAGGAPLRVRHRLLLIAGFTAFNSFYLFAGQPTLRRIPYASPMVALIAHAASTRILFRRWSPPETTRRRASLPVVA